MDKYLLVCEGPTDTHIIRKLAEKIYETKGVEVEIVVLAPQLDATTGKWERHGWNGVRNWCRKNGRKTQAMIDAVDRRLRPLLARQNWRAMIAISGAKGLIIQMDADIAEYITDIPAFDKNTIHRRDYCTVALKTWLNEDPESNLVHLAVTSYAIETWILATLADGHAIFADLTTPYDLEDVSDWEDRLVNAGFSAYNKDGKRRFQKYPSTRYVAYAEQVAEDLQRVREKCLSANLLCSYLDSPQLPNI